MLREPNRNSQILREPIRNLLILRDLQKSLAFPARPLKLSRTVKSRSSTSSEAADTDKLNRKCIIVS